MGFEVDIELPGQTGVARKNRGDHAAVVGQGNLDGRICVRGAAYDRDPAVANKCFTNLGRDEGGGLGYRCAVFDGLDIKSAESKFTLGPELIMGATGSKDQRGERCADQEKAMEGEPKNVGESKRHGVSKSDRSVRVERNSRAALRERNSLGEGRSASALREESRIEKPQVGF